MINYLNYPNYPIIHHSFLWCSCSHIPNYIQLLLLWWTLSFSWIPSYSIILPPNIVGNDHIRLTWNLRLFWNIWIISMFQPSMYPSMARSVYLLIPRNNALIKAPPGMQRPRRHRRGFQVTVRSGVSHKSHATETPNWVTGRWPQACLWPTRRLLRDTG